MGGKVQGLSNQRLRRFKIIIDLIGRGNYPSSADIRAKYEEALNMGDEIEETVSTKTINRDINFLVDEYDAPIEYDKKKHGYYFTEPNYQGIFFNISQSQLSALELARKALLQYAGTPIYNSLMDAFQKIQVLSSGEISLSVDQINKFGFLNPEHDNIKSEIWDKTHRAIHENCQMEFYYQKPHAEKEEYYTFHPYHLFEYRNSWFITGHSPSRNGHRTFMLSRFKTLQLRPEKEFTIPKDFNAEDYVRNEFMKRDLDKPIDVKVWINAFEAVYIKEKTWFENQYCEDQEDGSIIMSFQVKNQAEARQWILGRGERAKVLEPQFLRDEIYEIAKDICKGYES